MSVQISFELPESVFSALREDPSVFVQEMRLAAAIKWYELGMISQSKAAEIAGVTRHQLIEAFARFKVSPFQETAQDLAKELDRDQEMGG